MALKFRPDVSHSHPRFRNWRTAPITIGPRQMNGDLSVRKKPIEMSFTP
jgi:hypothetical protein